MKKSIIVIIVACLLAVAGILYLYRNSVNHAFVETTADVKEEIVDIKEDFNEGVADLKEDIADATQEMNKDIQN
jgi:hypothetical protein